MMIEKDSDHRNFGALADHHEAGGDRDRQADDGQRLQGQAERLAALQGVDDEEGQCGGEDVLAGERAQVDRQQLHEAVVGERRREVLEVLLDQLTDRQLRVRLQLGDELGGELALPGGEVGGEHRGAEQHREDDAGVQVGVGVVRRLDLRRDEEHQEGAGGRQEHAGRAELGARGVVVGHLGGQRLPRDEQHGDDHLDGEVDQQVVPEPLVRHPQQREDDQQQRGADQQEEVPASVLLAQLVAVEVVGQRADQQADHGVHDARDEQDGARFDGADVAVGGEEVQHQAADDGVPAATHQVEDAEAEAAGEGDRLGLVDPPGGVVGGG